MSLLHEFAREEKLPSYFMNRIQDFLSAARTDLRVSLSGTTKVEVVPVEPYGLAALDIQGRWRFRSTSISRTHPGGAEGTYTLWAVATDQNVVETPDPFTDETDYDFDLRITDGKDPEGEGVDIFEKIAEIEWDGSEITAIRQTYNAVTGPMIQDGALSDEGDLEWERLPGGALVPKIPDGGVRPTAMATTETLTIDSAALPAPASLLVQLKSGEANEVNEVGNGKTGQLVVFRRGITSPDPVFKDGEGNLRLAGSFTFEDAVDTLTLVYIGEWIELSRSVNGLP